MPHVEFQKFNETADISRCKQLIIASAYVLSYAKEYAYIYIYYIYTDRKSPEIEA